MRISFDIDDTLVCLHPWAPCEPNRVPFFLRPWFSESLRLGARALMRELARKGCLICIYTSSYRSPRYLKWWLLFYGVRIHTVINGDMHERWIKEGAFYRPPSKYPPAFGFDLHVDDLEGMILEGKKHGFDVVVVDPKEEDWTGAVLQAVERKQAQRKEGERKEAGARIGR